MIELKNLSKQFDACSPGEQSPLTTQGEPARFPARIRLAAQRRTGEECGVAPLCCLSTLWGPACFPQLCWS